jgi:integrase/recombinase XerD
MVAFTEGHSGGGAHAVYRSCRALFNFIEGEEILKDWKAPTHKVRPPRYDRVQVNGVIPLVVKALTETANGRDRAILFCLFDSGLRAQEFTSLTKDDIDLQTGRLIVRKSKSRKARVAFLGDFALSALREYLSNRKDDNPALWLNDENLPLRYEGLRALVKRRAKDVGIDAPKIHGFRHGFATCFVRAGGNVFALQKILGHADISTTRIYVNLNDEDLLEQHRAYSPLAGI